jgi:hypothetical protein
MLSDPKLVVAKGYDELAHEYLGRYVLSTVRDAWLDALISALPEEISYVLDLRCGAGVPVAKRLNELGHSVLGVDGSARQKSLARANVPDANFLHGDMTTIELAGGVFYGIVAFYSITMSRRLSRAGFSVAWQLG